MKLFSYKSAIARRRCLIYAVLLLFACWFLEYKFLLTFLRASVTSLTKGDNITDVYSKRNFRLKVESVAKQKRRTDSGVSLITGSTKSTAANLDTTAIADLTVPYSVVQIIDDNVSLVSEIASSLLATMDKTYVAFTTEPSQTCSTTAIIGNSCKIGSCLQLRLPSDLRTRVQQIVTPSRLQLNHQMNKLLSNMADKVPGYYDLIIVSAVSSSHFEEGQAMLHNIHKYIFPRLHNFTFIYYNLGLLEEQRDVLAKICKCHLIDFPFELLPEFHSFRKCYTWKPLIVNAHISRSNLILWIDASVRFNKDFGKFMELLNRARNRGMQVFLNKQTIAQITLPSMFHFFGDEACVYANSSVILGTVLLFQNNLFVKRAIVEPWAACAISRQCMCPTGVDLFQIRISCHKEKRQYYYGYCHRFDQSAISILLVKIYQGRLSNIEVAQMKEYLELKRGDKMQYSVENVTDVS